MRKLTCNTCGSIGGHLPSCRIYKKVLNWKTLFKNNMKSILTLIVISLTIFLSSCAENEPQYKQDLKWVCTCEQQKRAADFVTTNTKASNNMSDEEMEDVIKELRETSIKLNCSQRLMWQTALGGEVDWKREKLDSCEILIDINY